MNLPQHVSHLTERTSPGERGAWPPRWPYQQWATWELVEGAKQGIKEATIELIRREERITDD